MSKHFIIDPSKAKVDPKAIFERNIDIANAIIEAGENKEAINEAMMLRPDTLKFVPGRVVVKINTRYKNSHTFADGTKISLERQYNNFNQRETQPVNAIVVSSEYIPAGSEILVSHNAVHDSYRIFDYPEFSGKVMASDVKWFSVPERECFAWRDGDGVMKPMKDFEFGLRVYEPYKGLIQGIDPTLLVDKLLVTTGSLKGHIVGTLKSCDYEIIYQEKNGREARLIRFRHSDDDSFEREEVAYIDHNLTERYLKGGLMVGVSASESKTVAHG